MSTPSAWALAKAAALFPELQYMPVAVALALDAARREGWREACEACEGTMIDDTDLKDSVVLAIRALDKRGPEEKP